MGIWCSPNLYCRRFTCILVATSPGEIVNIRCGRSVSKSVWLLAPWTLWFLTSFPPRSLAQLLLSHSRPCDMMVDTEIITISGGRCLPWDDASGSDRVTQESPIKCHHPILSRGIKFLQKQQTMWKSPISAFYWRLAIPRSTERSKWTTKVRVCCYLSPLLSSKTLPF